MYTVLHFAYFGNILISIMLLKMYHNLYGDATQVTYRYLLLYSD